jgi:TRAP-type C4-dicarboxylate transport system permease small subunit
MLNLTIKFLKTTSAISLAILLLVVILIIADNKLDLGAVWANELARFMLVWIIMLGGTLAYAEHSHLGLDILVDKFDAPTKHASYILSHTLILLFALSVLIYGGYQLVIGRIEMGQTMPALQISRGWFYASLPLAGILISTTAIAHLLASKKLTSNPNKN